MPVRFVLALTLSALVPILGLSSCSKDQPQDGWSLKEPTIETGSKSYPVSEGDDKTLPPETVLKFTGSPWASLEVQSTCLTDQKKSYEDTFRLTYRETVALKSLWPRSLTMQMADTELVKSSCHFKFLATSDDQSTHEFVLNGMQLTSFVADSDPLLARRNLAEAVRAVSGNTRIPQKSVGAKTDLSLLEKVVDEIATSVGDESAISLNCEGTSVEAPFSEPSETIAQLLAKSTFSGTRYCHFVARRLNADTNQFAMSADAPLQFTAYQLDLSQSLHVPDFFNDRSILSVQIENPNSESVTVAIPANSPKVKLRVAYTNPQGQLVIGREISNEVHPQVSGASAIGDGIFQIPPHSTAVVRFTMGLGGYEFCRELPISGLRWGFESAYSISQLDESLQPLTKIFDAPTAKTAASYPISMIEPRWVEKYGATVPEWVQPGQPMSGSNCY